MKIDRVFVLLLVVLLPLTGCFDDAVGEADAQEDATDDTTDSSQSRTWYTSGGTYQTHWNEDNIEYSGYYCTQYYSEVTNTNNSSNYDYCYDQNNYESFADWDTTECSDAGGVASESRSHPRYAPVCTIEYTNISTSSGEALLIYQWDSFYLETTCGGVTESAKSWNLLAGKEYYVVTGSAMDCNHRLYYELEYDDQDNDDPNNEQFSDTDIWSIVYAIQDVTVVS